MHEKVHLIRFLHWSSSKFCTHQRCVASFACLTRSSLQGARCTFSTATLNRGSCRQKDRSLQWPFSNSNASHLYFVNFDAKGIFKTSPNSSAPCTVQDCSDKSATPFPVVPWLVERSPGHIFVLIAHVHIARPSTRPFETVTGHLINLLPCLRYLISAVIPLPILILSRICLNLI